MRRAVLAAAGLALLAAASWSAAPAQAMAISAPATLKGASDSISLAETVHCWGCGYYGGPRYYSGYYNGYANVAGDCYYRQVRVDDEKGGWVWGRKYSCGW